MPSQPPDPYQRQFSFTGWSVNHPGEPHQGDKLDIEFNLVRDAINDTQDRLAEIQDDDGRIKSSALPNSVLAAPVFDAVLGKLRIRGADGVWYLVTAEPE